MSDKTICRKHNTHSGDEKWDVMLEEIVDSGDVPFEGQVCPCCYAELLDTLKKTKRALKIESKSAVRLRREVSEKQAVLDVVMATVYELTGKDPQKLAEKEYEGHSAQMGGSMKPIEHGDIVNILPNLIVEAVSAAKRPRAKDA